MIALHFRDSPVHLIAPSQHAGLGFRKASADHPFTAALPRAYLTVTLNLRDLYRVRCYSLVDVVHNKDLQAYCQRFLWFYTKTT